MNSNPNQTAFISWWCFICQAGWWNRKYFWLYEEKMLWRQLVLSSRCFPTDEDKVSYSLTPFLSKDYSLGTQCQGKLASLSWHCPPPATPECSNNCFIHPEIALVNLFMSSSVKEELTGPNTGQKASAGRGEGCYEIHTWRTGEIIRQFGVDSNSHPMFIKMQVHWGHLNQDQLIGAQILLLLGLFLYCCSVAGKAIFCSW